VIGICARVDDVANGTWRELLNRSEHIAGRHRRTRVDHDDAVVSNLHADIAAAASNHEEIRAELEHFEPAACRNARLSALKLSTSG
jgi:hypothetical protein